jgi:isopropylmalate/homocitrate/citramalate synthase
MASVAHRSTTAFPHASDETYLRAVVDRVTNSSISALLLPGIGTVDHLRMAADCGVTTIRVATHCTEANVSRQHINLSRDLGARHGWIPDDGAHGLVQKSCLEQALLMESYGANCIYCTDSAGLYDGHIEEDPYNAFLTAMRNSIDANFASITMREPQGDDGGLMFVSCEQLQRPLLTIATIPTATATTPPTS